MKLFIATAIVAFSSVAEAAVVDMAADPSFPVFQRFMNKYNRVYTNQAEVEGRFAIFKDNLQLIAERNNDGGMDKHGINQFTDLVCECV